MVVQEYSNSKTTSSLISFVSNPLKVVFVGIFWYYCCCCSRCSGCGWSPNHAIKVWRKKTISKSWDIVVVVIAVDIVVLLLLLLLLLFLLLSYDVVVFVIFVVYPWNLALKFSKSSQSYIWDIVCCCWSQVSDKNDNKNNFNRALLWDV